MQQCAHYSKVNNGAALLSSSYRQRQRMHPQPVMHHNPHLAASPLQCNILERSRAGLTCRAAMRNDAPNNQQTAQPLGEAAKRVLLVMLTKMVHQESLLKVASPATDQLLRARPETTSMEFMLWVAEQEAQAQPGQQKELLASVCQRLVMFRELLDQERMDALFVSTSKALQVDQRHDEEAALLLGGAQPSLSSDISPSSTSSYRVQLLDSSGSESPSTTGSAEDGMDGSWGNGTSKEQGCVAHAGISSCRGVEDAHVCADENAQGDGSSGPELGGDRSRSRVGSAAGVGENNSSSSSSSSSSIREVDLVPSMGVIPAPSPLPPSLASRPEQYAVQLAQTVTGVPVVTDGYSPVYDLLLKAAPPAALTAEGVAKAHQEAAELGQDMRGRRQRSVASILGRTKLTPQQADQLKAGTAAARILDLLLSFPTEDERVALLPDCFTPPPDEVEQGPQKPLGQDPLGSEGHQWMQGVPHQAEAAEGSSSAGVEEETDELWCTPAQLLNELDARLRQMTEAGSMDMQDQLQQKRLGVPEGQLAGKELEEALQGLRLHVHAYFMQAMRQR
ncbi:hypothetical protein DUNSADRAFT_16441 [Dunaliella salina]|uniref:Uncharacterized protein n=1 Tax=Dunaliella salina TaxID=3046 RepID=A0ABQ7G3J9_DUNSA|nr:hypothetical protein DUNSADRAFT_16441 [Dunaliella salina]|eukprot:KAF5829176.1 hypothetical protein DUNSADRAFT_16441 [Dunaliella salina]